MFNTAFGLAAAQRRRDTIPGVPLNTDRTVASTWTMTNLTRTLNDYPGPGGEIGTNLCSKVVETTGNVGRDYLSPNWTTPAANLVVTYYIKKIGNAARFMLGVCGNGTDQTAHVLNLNSGALTNTAVIGGCTILNTDVARFPNGWYRVQVWATYPSSATIHVYHSFGTTVSQAQNETSYSGAVTEGVYLWGYDCRQV